MKIGSRIHPKKGDVRNTVVHGKNYAFVRTPDKHGDDHFVADVKIEEHAAVLCGSPDFYPFNDLAAPPAPLKLAPPAKTAASISTPPPAVVAFSPDVMAEAETLLKGTIPSISTDVGSVSSPTVVQAALAIETASETSRKGVVTVLQTTLDHLKAAGLVS